VKYYYDSRAADSDQRALLERLEDEGVEVVDTAHWTTGELTDVYYADVLPRGAAGSTHPRRAVRGRSGSISFETGVLVTPDGCFVGEDVERSFDALFPDLYVELYQD